MNRRTGTVLVDLLAVPALLALALVGLAPTFAGWGFLVIGVAAAALGTMVAALTARQPLALLVAAVPVGVLLLGGPVGLRDSGLGLGVPDLRTLHDVMLGTATGWTELLSTLPYVDVAGPPALVPFVLGYVGAALATALATRTRSAALPTVPLLAVLVVVLLLRRPEGQADGPAAGSVDWYPVGFAALAVGWIVVRSLRFSPGAEPGRSAHHGRASRVVAATVVVAAAFLGALSLTAGIEAPGGRTLRGQVRDVPDLAGLDSPLRRFRSFTAQPGSTAENVHRKLLFTVTGAPRGSRVRMVTLDRYDGREWLPGNDTVRGTTDDAFLRVDSAVDNPTRGRRIRAQVTIAAAYRSSWVPTVGSLTSFRLRFADSAERRDELRYDLATSTAVVPVGIHQGNGYEFTAIVPEDRLTASMQPWPAPVLQVRGLDRTDEFLRSVLAAPAPPLRKVFALAKYLRQEGRYSDGALPGESRYDAGHGLERLVDEFLLAPRPVGDDEQYAAAMALLANRVGVPARVVVGAVVPRDGKVRGEDVHAWVELRVSDGSWRTLPTREFMGDEPPTRNMPPAIPPRLPPSLGQPSRETPPPEVQQREQRAQQRARAESRSAVLRLAPWLLAGLLALVVPGAKLARRVVRRRRGRPSDRLAGAWAEIVDHARDLGVPVPTRSSRPAQARVLEHAGGLASRADDGVFAEEQPSEEEVSAYWADAATARRGLGAGRPLPRRLWAPFNPVSLVRRAGGRRSD